MPKIIFLDHICIYCGITENKDTYCNQSVNKPVMGRKQRPKAT